MNQLLLTVFTDALRAAENEENYETCADLLKYINNLDGVVMTTPIK